MAEKEKTLADEAKGFSQDIVNSLGLVELILGVVALYGLWLLQKDNISNHFPSTGITVVDVGLQLFTAALIGKIVCLIVAFPMALTRIVIKRSRTNHYRELENALNPYYKEKMNEIKSKNNLIDFGVKHLSLSDAGQKVMLDRQQTKIIIAYGAGFLAVIYLIYLKDFPTNLFWWIAVAAVIFFILGIAEQYSLVKEITQSLISLHSIEERKKELNPKKE